MKVATTILETIITVGGELLQQNLTSDYPNHAIKTELNLAAEFCLVKPGKEYSGKMTGGAPTRKKKLGKATDLLEL